MLVEAGKKTEAIALAESQPEVFCARSSAFVGIASQLIEEKKTPNAKIACIRTEGQPSSSLLELAESSTVVAPA